MLRKGVLGPRNPLFIYLLEHPFFFGEKIQRIIQARYRKHVDVIRDNVHLLIGGIAVQVAGKLGFAVAIVAALVAALLRVILQMGLTVFCKRFEADLL
jgi:hypothetical protein